MREKCELRVREKFSHLLFRPNEGTRLGTSIRKVILQTDDPVFAEVGRITHKLRKEQNEFFFMGWDFERKYTPKNCSMRPIFE